MLTYVASSDGFNCYQGKAVQSNAVESAHGAPHARERRAAKPLVSALGVAAVLLLVPTVASAATYYVSKSGSDAHTCASAQNASNARLTIRAGMGCLASGDTLEIAGGTYEESIFNNANDVFPDGIDATHLTTIRGAEGETVVWTNTGSDHLFLMKDCGSYTKFQNLRFDATKLSISESNSSDAWKHFRQDGKTTVGVVFVDNEVEGAPNNGIFNSVSTSGWLIEGNTVFDSGRGTSVTGDKLANNMYLEGDNHVVRRNRVYYTSASPCFQPELNCGGIRVANNLADYQSANNNVIERNHISGGRGGIIIGTGDNNIARNNVVDHTLETGILLWTQGTFSHDNNRIHNNTVYNSTRGIGTLTSTLITNSKATNNIIYDCTIPIDDPDNLIDASANFTGDPLFVDAAASNFHLQPGSPAIDAGATLDDVTNDFDAVPRPTGAAYDIGAFEYTDGTEPPCVASCDGRACGTGGCDGTCGVCPEGETCTAGQCEEGGESSAVGAGGSISENGASATSGMDPATRGANHDDLAGGGLEGGCACRTENRPSKRGISEVVALTVMVYVARRRSRTKSRN